MDFNAIFNIARLELTINIRNRWTLIFAFAFAALVVAIAYFGLVTAGTVGFQGFLRTSASLLNLVLYIVPLVALVMGTMSFTSEKNSGDLLYAQPVTRIEILIGKLARTLCIVIDFHPDWLWARWPDHRCQGWIRRSAALPPARNPFDAPGVDFPGFVSPRGCLEPEESKGVWNHALSLVFFRAFLRPAGDWRYVFAPGKNSQPLYLCFAGGESGRYGEGGQSHCAQWQADFWPSRCSASKIPGRRYGEPIGLGPRASVLGHVPNLPFEPIDEISRTSNNWRLATIRWLCRGETSIKLTDASPLLFRKMKKLWIIVFPVVVVLGAWWIFCMALYCQ